MTDVIETRPPALLAQLEINRTDFVVIKSLELGRTLSDEWRAWRENLRSIRNGGDGPIPPEPDRWKTEKPPSEAASSILGDAPTAPLGEDIEKALRARIAELEARGPETPPPVDPLGEELEKAREANRKLVNGDAKQPIPEEIAALLDEGETFTHDVRRKLTERLNVELAELKNLRGLAGEDLKREAEIEKLLGLFARLGEI